MLRGIALCLNKKSETLVSPGCDIAREVMVKAEHSNIIRILKFRSLW
jgi:hypothetical protein